MVQIEVIIYVMACICISRYWVLSYSSVGEFVTCKREKPALNQTKIKSFPQFEGNHIRNESVRAKKVIFFHLQQRK